MEHEHIIRLVIFFTVFLAIALWEVRRPRRRLTTSKAGRWFNNLGLVVINTVLLRILFPTAAIGVALAAEHNGWGLLNIFNVPYPLAIIIGVILMDMAIYLQHVLFHAVPLLWRLHMVHHTDLDYDLTTGLRFHPVEIILSMVIKFGAIILIGPPAIAVLIFEVLLNACAMFNHGNIRLPAHIDRIIRLLLVTPDMHRIHHSTIKRETNSNYGFSLSCWDRLFGTYRSQPKMGHENMQIGLNNYRSAKQLRLPHLLILPLSGKVGEYPINRD